MLVLVPLLLVAAVGVDALLAVPLMIMVVMEVTAAAAVDHGG